MQTVTKQTLKIFWQHSNRYKWSVAVLIVGILLTVAGNMIRPFLYKDLFNILISQDPNKISIAIHLVWWVLGIGLAIQAIWRVMGFFNSYYQSRIMSDLLNTCYEYILGHSYSFFSNNFIGSIVTKVRRFQRSFENVADQIYWNIGITALRVLAVLVILFFRLWTLGLVMLVWTAIYVAFAYAYSRFKLKYDIARANQDTVTTAHLADTLTNNLNLKLFTSKATEMAAFASITHKLHQIRQHAWNLGEYAQIFQGFSMVLLEFIIMYLAIHYYRQGILTIGDFALLQAYLTQVFDHLWDLGRYIRNLYESLADADEMTVMLMQPHEVVDKPGASQLIATEGAISFRDVNFHYDPSSPILQQFNLAIRPGERVALIGPSGGGKSTIVKLLFRFLDIQGGQILIDGQNIAGVTQDSLRSQISLVPQEPILFHRTLRDNIRYGRPEATDEEVIAAAQAAHCHEFITSFKDGYDTLVGERGVKLSGGERQRVAIARAILKNAPILVLDEATSSLDSESEHFIQDALHTLMKGKTTIVIAHRLSTIMEMDRIVVIEDGKITEQGKHEELLKAQKGTYQRLWQIQAGGFETAATAAT